MARILNLETATDRCSVAVSDGLRLLSLRESAQPREHAAQLTLLIQSALAEAGLELPELDAVAISSGPGSYTSLRVGAATAKGLCYALGKSLIAVDTLQSLALASLKAEREDGWYCPMIDARRMEVYTATFDAANECLVPARALILDEHTFEDALSKGIPIILSGNGAEKCRGLLPERGVYYSLKECSAALLVPLALQAFEAGRFEDLAYYSPFYLKPPNITVAKKREL